MKVKIKEILERVVEVDSISEAEKLYRQEDIVLDVSDYLYTEFIRVDVSNEKRRFNG